MVGLVTYIHTPTHATYSTTFYPFTPCPLVHTDVYIVMDMLIYIVEYCCSAGEIYAYPGRGTFWRKMQTRKYPLHLSHSFPIYGAQTLPLAITLYWCLKAMEPALTNPMMKGQPI